MVLSLATVAMAAPANVARQAAGGFGPSWTISNYDGRSTSPAGAIIHFNISYTHPQPDYYEPSFNAYCEYNTAQGGEQPCPVVGSAGSTWGVFASSKEAPADNVGIALRHLFITNPTHFFNVTGSFDFNFESTPQPAPPFEVTNLEINEHYCGDMTPC